MKFVILVDFTDKARQDPKSMEDLAARMSAGAKSMGGTIEHRYWGIGGIHDIVVVLDAPDGDTAAKLVTKGMISGNAVAKMMRVWSDEERAEIIKAAAG